MKPKDYVNSNNKIQFILDYLENDKRLMRLFAVACCYQIWDLIKDEQNQKAVEIAELFADGLATEEQRQKAYTASAANYAVSGAVYYAVSAYSTAYAYAAYASSVAYTNAAYTNVRTEIYFKQYQILQNMKGNWNQQYNTKDVTDLANLIYNQKSFELMPILADALQEAGCEDKSILEYCQTPNFYFRGCWILDKGIGKR